jgi:branched-chain amino acid transport system substrate-binding protein
VKFQQWDGNQWKVITDWVDSDRPLVRGMIEESAAVRQGKGHQARDCSKEKDLGRR